MKILDIRGNLLKIESDETFEISSLLKISSNDEQYIAQVLYTEHSAGVNIAFAKLVSNLKTPFSPEEINGVSTNDFCEKINLSDVITNFGETPAVVLGCLANENHFPTADMDFFDKRLLIVSENNNSVSTLINNYAHQIKNNGFTTIIFDTEGVFDGVRLTAGLDFKLPLNEHAINFIYEKYFSDITEESKAQITDIFTELKAYARTVPYIPFKTFKSVIDDVFDYSQNLSLFFFKTKLEKLYEANIFANTHEEVMDWSSLAEVGPTKIVVDLSHVNKIFIQEYISLVINAFKNSDAKLYAFTKLEESFTDKDFLKEILESENVIVSSIIRSNFKYISALKQNCASFVVFGGIKKPENFDYCKFLLKNIDADKYVITGEYTQPISITFDLREVSEVVPKAEELPTEEIIDINSYEQVENSVAENEDDQEAILDTPIADYEPEQIMQDSAELSGIETTEEIYESNDEKEFSREDDEEDIPLEELMMSENIIIESNDDNSDLASENNIEDEPEQVSRDYEQMNNHEESVSDIADYDPIDIQEDVISNTIDYEPIEEISEDADLAQEERITSTIEEYSETSEYNENITISEEPVLENVLEEEIFEEAEGGLFTEEVLPEIEKTPEEILDEQIKKDVDRVYMSQNPAEDELSEDDLDFIEELVGSEDLIIEDENVAIEPLSEDAGASEEEVLIAQEPEAQEIEPILNPIEEENPIIPTRNTATPAVPIYTAEIPQEAIVQSDPIQQGDRVIHVKFGIGIVEKIFSYGTKNFCSINFENIGRKVLDPNVTELKKA